MAIKYFDRVKEIWNGTGTGSVILSGVPSDGGFRAFSSVLNDGDQCYYCVQDTNNAAWEVGLGTYTAATTTIVRSVIASSNSNALVSFLPGTKTVFISIAAKTITDLIAGGGASLTAANIFTVGPQTFKTGADANVGAIVQGNSATQSVDLCRFQKVTGNTRAKITKDGEFSNQTSNDNTGTLNEVFGFQAGSSLTTGAGNNLFGYQCGPSINTGLANTGVGNWALFTATNPTSCTAIGHNALYFTTTGGGNTAVGDAALYNLTTGAQNVGCGVGTGFSLTTGNFCCFVGQHAGYYVTGNNNTMLGCSGSDILTSGNDNTGVGFGTNCSTPTTQYSIALGSTAKAKSNEFALSPYCTFQTFYEFDSTTTLSQRADFTTVSVSSTHGSNKYRIIHNAWDTAAREFMRGEASGTAAMIGFLGATAVVRQNTTGTTQQTAAGSGAAVKVDSTTTGGTGSTAYTVGDIVLALKNYGLLAS